jgi:MFS family permease
VPRRGVSGGTRPVAALLRRPGFRRLYAVRLTGQFGDGVFQAALAGSVLFNPDRQAQPLSVAIGFAVLLLPYSLLGPFTGVLLDRYQRRNVLVWANLSRAVVVVGVSALLWQGGRTGPFLVLALVSVAINRFILAGLSAGLPHVARDSELVTANALSPTSGTVAFTLGAGAAVGLTGLFDAGNSGYALVTLLAILLYLGSAGLAAGFSVPALGPDRDELTGESVRSVVQGMVDGVRHLLDHRAVGYALITVGLYRLGFGAATMALLLLYRNTLTGSGPFLTGEGGLGQVVLVAGAGAFLAAVLTPLAVRRVSRRAWMVGLLALTALAWPLLAEAPSAATAVGVSLLAGIAAQGVKIVVDAGVQAETEDAFRGRVFALYDMLFNVCLVIGLLVGAVWLPSSGRSWPVLGALGAGYLALAGWVSWWASRHGWAVVQTHDRKAVQTHDSKEVSAPGENAPRRPARRNFSGPET